MENFLKFDINAEGVLRCEKIEGDDNSGNIEFDTLTHIIGNIVQYVYHVDLGVDGLAIVIDEEGLLKELKPTFWLYNRENYSVESFPLAGKVLVVRLDGEDIKCLTEEEIEIVKSKVMVDKRSNRYFLPLNNEYIRESNNFLKDLFDGFNS